MAEPILKLEEKNRDFGFLVEKPQTICVSCTSRVTYTDLITTPVIVSGATTALGSNLV